jgi:hypothetical protein
MSDSETHEYRASCGLTLHITVSKEHGMIIRAGKSGTCQSILWERIAELINACPREKLLKILEGFACEKAIAGNKSCFAKILKMLKEAK